MYVYRDMNGQRINHPHPTSREVKNYFLAFRDRRGRHRRDETRRERARWRWRSRWFWPDAGAWGTHATKRRGREQAIERATPIARERGQRQCAGVD